MLADDVEGLRVDGLRTDSLPPPDCLIWLNQAHNIEIRGVPAAGLPASRLLRLTGASSNVFRDD